MLSDRQKPGKVADEINNLFAKYSVDGVGADYATPGAGTLNDYSVSKQIGE